MIEEKEAKRLRDMDSTVSSHPPIISRRRKVFIFAILCLNIFVTNLYFSLSMPFLTTEVVKVRKQVATIAGVLTGIFNFIAAATSIFAGTIASRTTIQGMMGYCSIAFLLSSLVFVVPLSNNALFDVVVAVSRSVQGAVLGFSEPMYVAAMGSLYPESLGMVTAVYELAFSASLSLGPLMGGLLYDLGGFYLPFTVTGILSVVASVMGIMALPRKQREEPNSNDSSSPTQEPAFRPNIFTLPILVLGLVVMMAVSGVETFVGNFLGVYLKCQYQQKVKTTGTILMLTGIFYSATTLLFGFLTDRGVSRSRTIVVGFCILSGGTLLVDTSLLGFFWPSFIYPGFMFGLVEIGSAMIQICVLPLLVFHDRETDMERSTEHMTGVYNAGFFLGAFIGPAVGSAILSATDSFAITFTVYAAVMILILLFVGVVRCKVTNLLTVTEKEQSSNNTLEKAPLLENGGV